LAGNGIRETYPRLSTSKQDPVLSIVIDESETMDDFLKGVAGNDESDDESDDEYADESNDELEEKNPKGPK
jgi:hypothetical protein